MKVPKTRPDPGCRRDSRLEGGRLESGPTAGAGTVMGGLEGRQ